jgi:hypothetical protein
MVSRTTALAAAVVWLAATAGPAAAQSRADATLRDLFSSRLTSPPIARYVAGDESFVLDRSGETPLLRFEGDREVWALRAAPGPRGDVIYKDDLGRPVIRATRLGGLTVFTPDQPDGLPAAAAGAAAGLKPAAISAVQLWRHLVRQSARVSRAVGRRISFEAPDVVQGSEALYADAAILTADAITREPARLSSAGGLAHVKKVEFREGERAAAMVEGESLEITIAPEHGLAGRPSSQRVLTALDRAD